MLMSAGPRVAAAAVQSALETFAKDDAQLQAELRHLDCLISAAEPSSTPDIHGSGPKRQGSGGPGAAEAMAVDGEGAHADGSGRGTGADAAAGVAGTQGAAEAGADEAIAAATAGIAGAAVAGPTGAPGEAAAAEGAAAAAGAAAGNDAVPTAFEAGQHPISAYKVRAACAAALAAAAVRARQLAEQEEREIQRLMVGVVDHMVKKLDIKMKYMDELDVVGGGAAGES